MGHQSYMTWDRGVYNKGRMPRVRLRVQIYNDVIKRGGCWRMDTMMLEATMQSAMEQMGLAAIHWYGVMAVITAVLLSVSWMAAGLLRESHEI